MVQWRLVALSPWFNGDWRRFRLYLTIFLIALLSLFAFVGQFLSKEINFERQPGKIRAVCNSE